MVRDTLQNKVRQGHRYTYLATGGPIPPGPQRESFVSLSLSLSIFVLSLSLSLSLSVSLVVLFSLLSVLLSFFCSLSLSLFLSLSLSLSLSLRLFLSLSGRSCLKSGAQARGESRLSDSVCQCCLAKIMQCFTEEHFQRHRFCF